MDSISDIWIKNKTTFDKKALSQILSFAGDGKLKDNNVTSKEFRDLLNQVPSIMLKQFSDNCLSDKFDDGGLALQDIINQIGVRLGFAVTHGLYRGRKTEIGFDGIWTSKEGHSIILEVKTSDAYRINLDTIAAYRNKLIDSSKIHKISSSILIVVGREDTGDLEAQIRGSQHAWDIRLLSTDSLLKLLTLKETLNDTKTIQQINELLKPKEYTRIDELIDLIFLTSQDIQLEESVQESDELTQEEELVIEKKARKSSQHKVLPVNFHESCLIKIQNKLGLNLVKQTRISFSNGDKSIGLICAISKYHKIGKYERFWFAFHPHQLEFLKEYKKAYVAYGCGSEKNIFLIPFEIFQPLIKNFGVTEGQVRMYWHIVIHHKDDMFMLAQPKLGKSSMVDITKYKV